MKAYLEKLIKVLNEEDLDKVKSISLKASKLKVFLAYLIKSRNEDAIEKEELKKYLRVDDKMYRKMKSVLLRKCYDVLCPEGGIGLLDILSRYRLVENFKRELLLIEKDVLLLKDSNENSRFYDSALTFLLRLPFSSQNVSELNQYSDLSLKYATGVDTELQALNNRAKILVIRLIHDYYQIDIENPNIPSYKKVFKMLDDGIKKYNDDRLKSVLNYCKALYAYCIDKNFNESKKLFSALKLNTQLIKVLPIDFVYSIDAFYGTSLFFLNEFDSAMEVFEKEFKKKSAFFLNQPHLLCRLSELYMVKGRMEEAKEILDNYLKRFLESGEPDAIELISITYSKYFMLNNELSNAFEYLQTARKHLNKKYYIIHDIDIRTLELIYFVMSGDLKFAKTILSRTIKFLKEKVKQKDLGLEIKRQEVIKNMCQAKIRHGSMKTFNKQISEKFTGSNMIAGMLLSRICIPNSGAHEV